jgi:hypothetical protein
MSIARLSGQMLQSTLLRDGINLSFQNIASSNSTLYLDIANTQVGINANVPAATLDVKGNVLADYYTANISVITSNVSSNGELTVSSSSTGNILINADGYTKVLGSTAMYVPVGNTGQRPVTPDVGALRFNTTNSTLEVWDGAEWDSATGGLSAITNQTIVPDGTADSILVSMNGVSQTPSIDYTVTGNSISFTTTPLDTDIVQVRFIASTATIIGIQNGNSIMQIANSNSNATVTIGGVANIATFASTGVYVDTLSAAANLALPVYTVAAANALVGVATGQIIFVSNGDSGNPCLAVYSGSAWRRIALGATIST